MANPNPATLAKQLHHVTPGPAAVDPELQRRLDALFADGGFRRLSVDQVARLGVGTVLLGVDDGDDVHDRGAWFVALREDRTWTISGDQLGYDNREISDGARYRILLAGDLDNTAPAMRGSVMGRRA